MDPMHEAPRSPALRPLAIARRLHEQAAVAASHVAARQAARPTQISEEVFFLHGLSERGAKKICRQRTQPDFFRAVLSRATHPHALAGSNRLRQLRFFSSQMTSKWKNRAKLVRPARVFAAPDPTLEATATKQEPAPEEPETVQASKTDDSVDQPTEEQDVKDLTAPG